MPDDTSSMTGLLYVKLGDEMDAAFFNDMEDGIRDDNGAFITSLAMHIPEKIRVDEGEAMDDSVFGDIVRACKAVLRVKPYYSVRYIRRHANDIAHRIAKASRSFSSSHCWIEPPAFMDGIFDTFCDCSK
ncbi:hypothetical protein ACS0TY_005806 [Phlomoides rotata]